MISSYAHLSSRTLFESNQSWPLKDCSDPLGGWNIFDILNETPRAAASDVYGKLYFYLQQMLKVFIEKSISLDASFQLFNVDAEELSSHLERETFSRIEVSLFPTKLQGYLLTLSRWQTYVMLAI